MFYVLGNAQNEPPPDSWASDPENDVAIFHITIQPGGNLTLPKSLREGVSRSVYLIEGGGAMIHGKQVATRSKVDLDASQEVEVSVGSNASQPTEFLLLQGKPIAEPVAQHGPFVMNTRAEIEQAFRDYGRTQFGGWPWPKDDHVFPRDKGRFALMNGAESTPEECTIAEKDT